MTEGGAGFMKLNAWKRADDLASAVFRVAQQIPSQHRWLSSQITRAAVSVPANIAEGYGRGSIGDYTRFLDIARGSLSEVEYYIHFLRREGLAGETDLKQLALLRAETGRLLYGLWQSLKTKSNASWDHSGGAIKEVVEDRHEVS